MEFKTMAIIFFVILASIMPIFTIVYDITDIRLILTSICWVFCIGLIGLVIVNGIDVMEENTRILKVSLNKNYKGYTDLGDDTFVYEGKKYSYSYDYDKKKLTVFLESSSSIDGVYVNGEKQNNTSSNSNSEKNDSDTETTNKDVLNNIKSKINEKYPNALITSFNPDYTGSFTYNDTYYNYSLKNDMLEIVNLSNEKDIVFL